MDIHRCRFIPYPSSAINALAFSHESSLTQSGNALKTLRLAIGRANGDIDIWNPQGGHWFQESILRGGKSRSIEALVWTQEPIQRDEDGTVVAGKLRLFSIGYSTIITEWDLALGRAIRHCSGNFGEIWCLAAEPRADNLSRGNASQNDVPVLPAQQLVAGCADGTLVLHSTADEDLKFLRPIGRSSKKKARVLSVAFQTRERVVAGYADSTVRVYGTEKGQTLNTMTLGKSSKDASSAVLVWTIKILPDKTIVSGDSSGQVTFWDGNNFTRLQYFQSHTADILDLAVSADGNMVVSGGMDRKSVFYQRPKNGGKGGFARWEQTSHRRFHEHHVKAMATYESRDLSVIASGGLDTAPVIIPFREYATEYHRKLPHLEQRPRLQSAPRERLFMSWWGQEVNIWRLGKRRENAQNEEFSEAHETRQRALALKMLLKGEENLSTASLASNGKMLALATMAEVKLFRLRRSKRTASVLRPQKVDLPTELGEQGARVLQFSPDSKWLAAVDSTNSLCLYRITIEKSDGFTTQILKRRILLEGHTPSVIQRRTHFGHHGTYDRMISHLAFSEDSRILVSACLNGKMDSWVLEGYEDLTQNAGISLSNGVTRRSSKDGDSSSDDGDDKEGHDSEGHDSDAHGLEVILGQHWVRNPAPALPLLSSPPLILSFRATSATSTTPLTNGNIGLHPTRHNAHPHSHDLPTGEDRLVVVTSKHGLYEYNVLTGKLSEWSRRNSRNLPSGFFRNRDRVMGSLWDIRDGQERLWLYGISWLGMFDLAKDFPDEVRPSSEISSNENSETVLTVNGTSDGQQLSKKRKRGQSPSRRKQGIPPKGSGGGNRAHQGDSMLGIKDEYRISHGPDSDRTSYIRMVTKTHSPPDYEDPDGEDDEDVACGGGSSTLVQLRRTARPSDLTNGSLADSHDAEDTAAEDEGEANDASERPEDQSFWCTQRYRPILGIVPIEGGDEDSEAGDDVDMTGNGWIQPPNAALEVALVERPLWDLDLPARFVEG